MSEPRAAVEAARAALAERSRHERKMDLYVKLLVSSLAVAIAGVALSAFAAFRAGDAARNAELAALGSEAQSAANAELLQRISDEGRVGRETAQQAVRQLLVESERLDQVQQDEIERTLNEVLAAITAEVRDPQNIENRPTPSVGLASPQPQASGTASPLPRATPPPVTPQPTTGPRPTPTPAPTASSPSLPCQLLPILC